MQDSFKARRKLDAGGRQYEYFALEAIGEPNVGRLPYSLKILLENLLRHEDGKSVTRDDIVALAKADPRKLPAREIAFTPARVIMACLADRPERHFAPAARQRHIEFAPARLEIRDQAPEASRMIHVPGMRELMDQEVIHDLGRLEQQAGVQADRAGTRAATPARALAPDLDPFIAKP